jgi:hypothetical protein
MSDARSSRPPCRACAFAKLATLPDGIAPGLGRESDPGKPRINPGFPYVRVALVNDLSTIMKAFERMIEILGGNSR